VKIHIQFTPVLTAAFFCVGIWYAFWLFAFRPVPTQTAIAAIPPTVTRLVALDETVRIIKEPSLFALPSGNGFSGSFLADRIDLRLSLEKPSSPERFLPHETSVAPGINRSLLTAETGLPQTALPAPGTSPQAAIRPVSGIQLFLSPELKPRMIQSNIAVTGLTETVRVTLTVRSDGTVEHAFFESPVTNNTALLGAIRNLQFTPAAEKTEGWIDIYTAQEEKP